MDNYFEDTPKEVLLDELFNKANLSDAPTKIELFGEHYVCDIGIGKDHTAQIIISGDALKALKEFRTVKQAI